MRATLDWRPVPDWPTYMVSDTGRVRSVERTITDSIGRVRRLRGVADVHYRTIRGAVA